MNLFKDTTTMKIIAKLRHIIIAVLIAGLILFRESQLAPIFITLSVVISFLVGAIYQRYKEEIK